MGKRMNIDPNDLECLFDSDNEIVLAILHLASCLDARLLAVENQLQSIAQIADHYGAVYASQEI